MAFSYDGRGLPRLNSYTDALKFWESASKWRSGDDNERKLDGYKKHVNIRRLHDGSIACRLHSTDVITFHPDNTMTVKPWRSISTDSFFNNICMRHGNVYSMLNQSLMYVNKRYYQAVDTLKFQCDSMQLLSEPVPFKITTINRKRATAARNLHDYKSFATWVRMMASMDAPPEFPSGYFANSTILARLSDRGTWPTLITYTDHGARIDVPNTLKRVREAIYRMHPEVYDVEAKQYLTTWTEIRAWNRRYY